MKTSKLDIKYIHILWLSMLLLLTAFVGVMVGFLMKYPSVPLEIREPVEALEVKEPIEVVSCPSDFGVFPGETKEFGVVIRNLSAMNYSLVLVFCLSDVEYQSKYVSFSDETYVVGSGEHVLDAWFTICPEAPAKSFLLTVPVSRETSEILEVVEIPEVNDSVEDSSSSQVSGRSSISSSSKLIPSPEEDPTDVSKGSANWTFLDHFEGTLVDPEKWIVQENTDMSDYPAYGGSVRVEDSKILLSSEGSSFPYVTSAVDPFPVTGDFCLEFDLTYNKISDWGNGIWISNGSEASPSIFAVWADNDGWDSVSITATLFGDDIYSSKIYGWEPSAPTHTFRLEYSVGVYTVFIYAGTHFGMVQVASASSQLRPDAIGFGHRPIYYVPFSSERVRGNLGGWSSFEIDYITVETTTQTFESVD